MHRIPPTLRAVAVVALSLAFAGCLEAGSDPVDAASAPQPLRALVVGGADGNEFSFAPATLAAKAGQTVEVRFVNDGREPHTFTIFALRADTGSVSPGDEATLTFRPTRAGTFEIVCTLPGHVEQGMTGALKVA